MTALITVLLVDDHAVVREGYRRLLERDEGLTTERPRVFAWGPLGDSTKERTS